MNSKRKFGMAGEQLAVDFLKYRKYEIIEKNYRVRNGEIDIIAIDKSEKEPVLAFIEVKTRSSEQFGKAIESTTPWIVTFLVRTANVYKLMHKNLPDLLRIDAVTIDYAVTMQSLSLSKILPDDILHL